jgi:hypothetical protein
VPEICRFYGIIIRMFFDDHYPPHFHAEYGEYEARINIQSLAVFAGKLPPRALGLVIEWAALHQEELLLNWQKAQNASPVDKIDPLR